MDRTPQLFTAEDVEALGDKPLFFRNLWSAEPSAGPTPSPPSLSRPVEARPRPAAEAREPRGTAARPYSSPVPAWDAAAAGAPGLRVARHRRPRKARRWPLALAFGSALGAGIAAVLWLPELLLPPSAAVASRDAARLRPASPVLAAGQSTPPSPAISTLAPVPRPESPASAAQENGKFSGRFEPPGLLKTAAVAPATPPAGASTAAEPLADAPSDTPPPPPADASSPAAAPTATADPPAAPNGGARASNPLLALALLRRAEDALARQDIAAARAFYVRAAAVDPWSIEALAGAGKTYDPEFLSSLGVRPGLGDPAEAQRWYDRAARLSDPSAAPVLAEQRPPDDGR